MLNGKKSALKNHLSTKKQTWAHKIVAHDSHEHTSDTERQMDNSLPTEIPRQSSQIRI